MSDTPGCLCSICEEEHMNKSDSSDSVGRSADLRTRIATVLYAMDCDDYDIQAGEELDPSVLWAIREGAERRADAVIRELGLTKETRYVTEWTADD